MGRRLELPLRRLTAPAAHTIGRAHAAPTGLAEAAIGTPAVGLHEAAVRASTIGAADAAIGTATVRRHEAAVRASTIGAADATIRTPAIGLHEATA
ncbi:MAG: hypothetical protein Q8S29_00890, partial [Phreatobacter sp.]|nr:hypothetical protein [Phreatobacter sp.]